MKKYLITVEATWTIEVEADNEDQAMSIASDYDSFDNYQDNRTIEEIIED